MGTESLAPIGFQTPDRPARIVWLYRLRYPDRRLNGYREIIKSLQTTCYSSIKYNQV